MQEDFVANLMDSIDSGIGRLVDADMNEESTRLKALQTQQQLGIQSLSIANTNSENILRSSVKTGHEQAASGRSKHQEMKGRIGNDAALSRYWSSGLGRKPLASCATR
jgi:hypothetical protein